MNEGAPKRSVSHSHCNNEINGEVALELTERARISWKGKRRLL